MENMINSFVLDFTFVTIVTPVLYPLFFFLAVGLFFFVLKLPKNIGIFLGWLPSFAFLVLTIYIDRYFAAVLIMMFSAYITATVLRILKNKKIKKQNEKLKEIDKMSIKDM